MVAEPVDTTNYQLNKILMQTSDSWNVTVCLDGQVCVQGSKLTKPVMQVMTRSNFFQDKKF